MKQIIFRLLEALLLSHQAFSLLNSKSQQRQFSFIALQPDGFVQGDSFNSNPVYGAESRPLINHDQSVGPMVRAGWSQEGGVGGPENAIPARRMDPSAPQQNHQQQSTIQGNGSRATFSSPDPYGTNEMNIHLGTAGRPLYANVENWSGPNNAPTKMKLYSEDGGRYPWRTKFQTPNHIDQAGVTEVRNTGPMEFPIEAAVTATPSDDNVIPAELGNALSAPKEIQGGDLTTFGFDADVEHVYVQISSEGMPIYAKVELYQGPMTSKAIADIYSDHGVIRPWSAVIPIPGEGASLCILNEGPMAYPITVRMDPPPRSISF